MPMNIINYNYVKTSGTNLCTVKRTQIFLISNLLIHILISEKFSLNGQKSEAGFLKYLEVSKI